MGCNFYISPRFVEFCFSTAIWQTKIVFTRRLPLLQNPAFLLLMSAHWSLLYRTASQVEAALVQGFLQENAIEVMMLNRQDSSYQIFGELELYVPGHLKQLAADLLAKALLN